jgi:hypothetical protein
MIVAARLIGVILQRDHRAAVESRLSTNTVMIRMEKLAVQVRAAPGGI